MAAKRKYTDVQRETIWNLYVAGHQPQDIADRCRTGAAGVPAFEIPRRTASEVIRRRKEAEEANLPYKLADISHDDVAQFPARIAALADAELRRLEAKAAKGRLVAADLRALEALTPVATALQNPTKNPQIADKTTKPGMVSDCLTPPSTPTVGFAGTRESSREPDQTAVRARRVLASIGNTDDGRANVRDTETVDSDGRV